MNKQDFLYVVRENIKRTGIEKLISSLECSDFFIAPASTKYHDSCEGGLMEHSYNVYSQLRHDLQYKVADGKYSEETIAIAGLFHDVCKIGYYKTETRNTKDENGKWIQVPFYTVDDKLPYGHGEKSVFMLQEFIHLTLEEAMAIRWHMGGFENPNNYQTLSTAFSEFPLALHLHIADMKSIYLK